LSKNVRKPQAAGGFDSHFTAKIFHKVLITESVFSGFIVEICIINSIRRISCIATSVDQFSNKFQMKKK